MLQGCGWKVVSLDNSMCPDVACVLMLHVSSDVACVLMLRADEGIMR